MTLITLMYDSRRELIYVSWHNDMTHDAMLSYVCD